MPSASIIISQSSVSGRAGKSRDDLVTSLAVTLTNSDNQGVVSHRWLMLDRPEDSSAELSGSTSAICTFTPDVVGTYRIQLAVNEGNKSGQVQTVLCAVRNADGTRYFAYGETGPECNWEIDGSENTRGRLPDERLWQETIVSDSINLGQYGDASDGDVTVSGTDTLAGDLHADTLTITSTGILNTAGYRIFAHRLITEVGAVIRRNGNNGGNGASGVAGTAGAALSSGTIGGSLAGGAGGGNSTAGSSASNSNLPAGGNGGDGGASNDTDADASEAGGLGGVTAIEQAASPLSLRTLNVAYQGITVNSAGTHFTHLGGCGGGGGGGGDDGTGGGGGSGGGVIVIWAFSLEHDGEIQAVGGNGGAGFLGTASGSGGGGGGGGGLVYLVYRRRTGSGTVDVSGGAGGAAAGTGAAGSAGNDGVCIELLA